VLAPVLAVVLVLTMVILAPAVVTIDPLTQHLRSALRAPSPESWLGTDRYGRDVFARVIDGTRTSVLAALAVVGICFAIGLVMGAIAAIAPPVVRSALSGLIDLGLGIPGIVVSSASR
jgi:peptide/nickel transport system permease protein